MDGNKKRERKTEQYKDLYETFRKNLLVLLDTAKLTQKELSNQLGFRESRISGWMKGNRLPTIDYLMVLCDYFHVSLDYFFTPDATPLRLQTDYITNEKPSYIDIFLQARNLLHEGRLNLYPGNNHKSVADPFLEYLLIEDEKFMNSYVESIHYQWYRKILVDYNYPILPAHYFAYIPELLPYTTALTEYEEKLKQFYILQQYKRYEDSVTMPFRYIGIEGFRYWLNQVHDIILKASDPYTIIKPKQLKADIMPPKDPEQNSNNSFEEIEVDDEDNL